MRQNVEEINVKTETVFLGIIAQGHQLRREREMIEREIKIQKYNQRDRDYIQIETKSKRERGKSRRGKEREVKMRMQRKVVKFLKLV